MNSRGEKRDTGRRELRAYLDRVLGLVYLTEKSKVFDFDRIALSKGSSTGC